jgi:hypothetical protein
MRFARFNNVEARLGVKMKKSKLYLIGVQGGVEPSVIGPFKNEFTRDESARAVHKQQKADDSLFWADVDGAGRLMVGSYIHAFFREGGMLTTERGA